MILFILTIFFCTILPAQAANLPPITGVQFFPADHIWNVPIDKMPVSPMSGTYISSANSSAYLYVYKGYYYNIVNSSTPKKYMTSITYASASDNVPVPIPQNPLVETASADHGMDIIDTDSKIYYQIFNAKQAADGTWSCGSLAVFDLSTMHSDRRAGPQMKQVCRHFPECSRMTRLLPERSTMHSGEACG